MGMPSKPHDSRTRRRDTAVRIIVGKEHRDFLISRHLLTSTSRYFRDRLNQASSGLPSSPQASSSAIWLKDDSADMFELFTRWLYAPPARRTFHAVIDDALGEDDDYEEEEDDDNDAGSSCRRLLRDLVDLHLFAARIGLAGLQDAAMDGIQDLHLRRDWDMSCTPPQLVVSHVHAATRTRDAVDSTPLRRWIAAMTAWTLSAPGDAAAAAASRTDRLFRWYPTFRADYVAHLRRHGAASPSLQLQLHLRNPQLRLPSNRRTAEEAEPSFAFRQCEFHTHRVDVGQGRCPHTLAAAPSTRLPVPAPLLPAPSAWVAEVHSCSTPNLPAGPGLRGLYI